MSEHSIDTAQSVLGEALEVDASRITLVTREPLGAGSVQGADVSADGSMLRYYLDTSRLPVAAETGLLLGTPAEPDARIWLHPADPYLPSLSAAAFGDAAATLLQRLGRQAVSAPEFVAYRPGRRAVLRAPTAQGLTWVKVVRPSRIERIVTAHTAFSDAGLPVPELLGWSAEGLIVFADAQGIPAPDMPWAPERLLDEVDELRTRIRSVDATVRVHSVRGRLDWYAERIGDVPGARDLVRRIRGALSQSDAAEPASVHGDLHFGQLFLTPEGSISALIDVDTAGTGAPAEDSAAFTAHAVASATQTVPARAGRVWELADAATDRWRGESGMPALTAIHLLGHALAAADAGHGAGAALVVRCGAFVLDGRAPSGAADSKSVLIDPFESP